MAIPFFRKGPESPSGSDGKPAKKPVSPADPHTSTLDFTHGDARALAQAANRIHVDEVSDVDHPAVEEAAILFANGSDDAAAATLEAALEGAERGNEVLWAMLFDLYRLTGKREPFEQHGVAFATQFGRSPPVWAAADTTTAAPPPRDSTPSISLTGALGATAGKQFEQISRIATKAGKLKIDLARLRTVDEAGCEQLLGLLRTLRQARVKVQLANARTMLPMIEGHATAGRREGQAVWLMVLELLQALSEAERFDDVALDYAITFEESPPSYEAPPAVAAPSMMNSINPVCSSGGLALVPIETDSSSFAFEGPLTSAQGEPLRKLAKFGADRQSVEIDASALTRMDFVSAGNLFNVLVQMQSQGKLCVFRQLNAMVAALLRVMGVHQVATLELRKL